MNANEAYKDRRKLTSVLIKEIKKLLDTHEQNQAKEPNNWGFVGDIEHINKQLKDITHYENV